MSWLKTLTSRLAALFRKNRLEQELDEELRGHLELMVDENIRRGMSAAEARHAARQQFGGVEQTKELYRDQRSLPVIETLLQDVRYGLRILARNPGVTIIAIITLALGIGANTAIFSVTNAILLRPPAGIKEPSQLVRLVRTYNGSSADSFSYPNYVDLRDQSTGFSGLAAYRQTPVLLRSGDTSERAAATLISGNYFSELGVGALKGRLLRSDDISAVGANPVVVISAGLWRQRYGGDIDMVGKFVNINGYSFTVVGVADEGFVGTETASRTDLWLPISMYGAANPVFTEKRLEERHIDWIQVFGRLKDGVAVEQGQAQLVAVARNLERAYPATNTGMGIKLIPSLGLEPQRRDELRRSTGLLMAVVGLILLIACANVASLLLARATARRKEIGIRLALGASRMRLVRQLLTESLLLALGSGALGLLLASWATKLLLNAMPLADLDTTQLNSGIDRGVLGFTLIVTFAAGLGSGLVPALQTLKAGLVTALKDKGAGGANGSRFHSLLVTGQIALSVVVLICAGLFVRTLINAQTVQPGFNPDNVLITALDPGRQGYPENQGRLLYQQVRDRIANLPGVSGVSLSISAPLSAPWRNGLSVEGQPAASTIQVFYNVVSPHYFETLRIPFISGRDFSQQDGKDTPRVAIINETLAHRLFPGQSPLGKRLSIPFDTKSANYCEIIGVVKDVKYQSMLESPQPYFYLPALQHYEPFMVLNIRAANDPTPLIPLIQREIHAQDGNLMVFNVRRLADRLQESLGPQRNAALLVGIFGLLALTLASIGLYGVMAYRVVQRTNEIGIRLALGAQPGDIARLVGRQAIVLASIGVAVGLGLSFALTRLIGSLLYGIKASDPLTFAAISLLLGIIALLACIAPARRAMRVDPIIALKYE